MPSLGSTTLLRGFKVSISVLDAFLAANCVPETFGTPPFHRDHPDNDSISKLLFSKITEYGPAAVKNQFRVVIPSRAPYNASRIAYVTHAWATVYAHREVDLENDLPAAVPEGFEDLRQEILSHGDGVNGVKDTEKIPDEGKMGVYMVYTFEIRGSFTPSELLDRKKGSKSCMLNLADLFLNVQDTSGLRSVQRHLRRSTSCIRDEAEAPHIGSWVQRRHKPTPECMKAMTAKLDELREGSRSSKAYT